MLLDQLTLFTLWGPKLGSCLHLVVAGDVYKMSDAQCNCSPIADWCPDSSWEAVAHLSNSPQLNSFFSCTVPYSMENPFGHFRSAFLVLPPPRSSSPISPSLAGQYKKFKNKSILGCVQHCSAQLNIDLLSTLLFSESQNSIILDTKENLCTSWNQDTASGGVNLFVHMALGLNYTGSCSDLKHWFLALSQPCVLAVRSNSSPARGLISLCKASPGKVGL